MRRGRGGERRVLPVALSAAAFVAVGLAGATTSLGAPPLLLLVGPLARPILPYATTNSSLIQSTPVPRRLPPLGPPAGAPPRRRGSA